MKKTTNIKIIPRFLLSVMILLVLIVTLYPFYYVFIVSISDPSRLYNIFLVPHGFTLQAYKSVFSYRNILGASVISVARTFIGTMLTVIASSFFAYLMTKNYPGRKLFYRLLVVTMYLNAGLIPWFITMKAYGLSDSFLLYVVPTMLTAFYVILVKTFIEQIPKALEESAIIDGAGFVKIFKLIIFPLSKPIIATIAVFAAVNQWNAWMDNYLLVNNPKLQTLQLMLYNCLNEAEAFTRKTAQEMGSGTSEIKISPVSIRMAITMIVTLPIIFVYPYFQKYFIKGIMLGAVKG